MKNLTVAEGVSTSPAIFRALLALDYFFEGYPCTVSSGFRSPESQLALIVSKCKDNGVWKLYDELALMEGSDYRARLKIDGGPELFWWQRGWSKLLNIGQVINPPVEAEALFDYFRPGSEVNRKGRVIQPSNHSSGNAFDIGGKDRKLDTILERVVGAKESGKCFIVGQLMEPQNNCVHVDVEPV